MITMKDTCSLVEVVSDGYGDKSVNKVTEVSCLFLQNSGRSHSANTDVSEADAHVYLDIENPEIKGRGYRIEGLYLIIAPFGQDVSDAWYRISRVTVGQRKLLDNDVDNVHAFLRKVAPLENGNVS